VDLVTTGHIARSGDAKLDGEVRDPRELVRKLADSERVRQVFVRHAFRFFLGRNESLADAYTLQQADAAYVASGGSFKALVVSLLTSDSFLYRTPLAESSAVSLRELP
jgi:predicted nucleic acid-binding protein